MILWSLLIWPAALESSEPHLRLDENITALVSNSTLGYPPEFKQLMAVMEKEITRMVNVRADQLVTEAIGRFKIQLDQRKRVPDYARRSNQKRKAGLSRNLNNAVWYDNECSAPDADNFLSGSNYDDGPDGLDTAWMLINGGRIFFMQAGFAMLECGAVRASNAKHILLKNLLDALVSAFGWFFVGFPFAYGYTYLQRRSTDAFGAECFESVLDTGNAFSGMAHVGLNSVFSYCGDPMASGPPSAYMSAMDSVPVQGVADFSKNDEYCIESPIPTMSDPSILVNWFFQWTFSAASSTIISGAVAERATVEGYMIISMIMSFIVYPSVVAWVWSGHGWAASGDGPRYFDFAGSGVVHLVGGIGALVGAIICGPRPLRFEEPVRYSPNNLPLVYMGTLMLWFGWYSFNTGSSLGMSSGQTAATAGLVATTTSLAACSGGLACFLAMRIHCYLTPEPTSEHATMLLDLEPLNLCNGILSGLVAVTAGCSNILPWASIVVGFLAGLLYYSVNILVEWMRIDDPLGAFAIHGANGLFGTLCVVIFDLGGDGYFYGAGDGSSLWYNIQKGSWEGVTKLEQLAHHLMVDLAIISWTAAVMGTAFLVLKYFGILLEDELTLKFGKEEASKVKRREALIQFETQDVLLAGPKTANEKGKKKNRAAAGAVPKKAPIRKRNVQQREAVTGWRRILELIKRIYRAFC